MKTKSYLLKVSTLFITIVVFSVAYLLQSCSNEKNLTSEDLNGYWVLKSLEGKVADSVFKGALPTIEFNFNDSVISGTGGCNSYTGKFKYEKGIFSVQALSMTEMLCAEDNAEPEFFLNLSDKENILSLKDGILTFKTGGRNTLVFEKGSVETEIAKPTKINSKNLDGKWILSNIDGADATSRFSHLPFVIFDFNKNYLSGNSGCNNFNASFELNGGAIKVFNIVSTKKMSGPDLTAEDAFIQAINGNSTLSLPNSNILQWAKGNNVLLELKKVSTDN